MSLKPEQIIYADEAGMDSRDDYAYGYSSQGERLSYSPDLNKIERCWSWLKSRIRHQLKNFPILRDAIEYVLRNSSH